MTAWDEMVNGHGGVRSHWRAVLGAALSLEAPGLAARASRLARAAEEEGSAASWLCDPVPLPLPGAEFAALEDGLRQRARLLDALLADLYGPQTTLASGAVPPALIFANPNFLRACRGGASQGPMLQAYAADLVRGPDGQWRVLADRTRGAFGAGYARETRRLLARVVPELFRGAQIRPLLPFFDAWQEALTSQAEPSSARAPFVAMLTHGVQDPHWPEHSALSRDLRCALVEARDLTVRDGKLHLKTLRGLQQIDVLLRRIPGDQLDPLDAPGAGMGVVGLLDAARQGAVKVLNHPGSAVLEAPALAAFMPSLCRQLLGEALRLPTLPSLWLADGEAKRTVATGFKRWSIRSAFDPATPPVPLDGLSLDDRIEVGEAVAAEAWKFVACTDVPPSVAPCQGPDGLAPQPVVLRLFLMHDGADWRVMPGGIARVLTPGSHPGESLPADGVFKDVWVLSEENADIAGPEPAPHNRLKLRRSGGDLPSRVADDFFWLGRYVERLEGVARLARVALLRRARGTLLPRETAELAVLGSCLAAVGVGEACAPAALEGATRALLLPGGAIRLGLDHASRLVASLRDRLALEAHGAFVHAIRQARADTEQAQNAGVDGLVHAMTSMQRLATTVAGVAAEGMVFGGGRLFLDLGRRIERGAVTANVLAAVLDQPVSRVESALRLALELCDSVLTYQNRYNAVLQPDAVLDLVLADTSNPRALAFQFAAAAEGLDAAGDEKLARRATALQSQTIGLLDQVVEAADPEAQVVALPPLLHDLGRATAILSDAVTRRFFALLPRTQEIGLEVA